MPGFFLIDRPRGYEKGFVEGLFQELYAWVSLPELSFWHPSSFKGFVSVPSAAKSVVR
jgi:hypothetical protein